MNFWLSFLLSFSLPAFALIGGYNPSTPKAMMAGQTPRELQNVGITEHVGDNLDLNLNFKDESGRDVLLKDYFRRGRPVVFSLVYYTCPHLCNFHLNGLTDTFKQMPWTLGNQFEAIAVSIDSKETPALAQAKKDAHMKVYGRPDGARGWHFLTGQEAQIHKLAEQVGFKYYWDEAGQQWAHASAAIIVTAEGKISRYYPGIAFDANSFKLSLLEASEGKVGGVIDSLIMYCFQFDPLQHKYVFYAWNIMRFGAALTLLVLGSWLAIFWSRQRKQGVRL